jgi:cytochrome oxidase Cu insertion factor (SCO1/SenC/PrrC family)/thiol-disulfide isomerase/thioredoxin
MSRRAAVVCVLGAILASVAVAGVARADGDPGSDVLVFQNLFVRSDAGLSVRAQAQFGGLLQSAVTAGFPVRVAIIASRYDLGAVSALWGDPRGYAQFLGTELSLAYKQRLLVVMPSGFGFTWADHATAPEYAILGRIQITPGGGGLLAAAQMAVRGLAGAAIGAAVLAALVALGVAIRFVLRRRLVPGVAMIVGVAGVAAVLAVSLSGGSNAAQGEGLATNPELDPGTSLYRGAPDFMLSNQFGQPVSLRSFRGKVVLLAFNDSECTTLCPLTTTAMLEAKELLGAAGSRVQLLGVDADPAAISLEDVWSYSELHGMLHQWDFVTGSLDQLRRVWRAYAVEAEIERGLISHTPALFVIGPTGREAKVYITQQSYAAVGQFGQLLAQESSSLLPDHPRVRSDLPYTQITGIAPNTPSALPRAGGGTVQLGPGRARLFVFFATWDQEVTSLAGHLEALKGYVSSAAASGLPALTAVDESSVEPSPATLADFVGGLSHPLAYPVALDRTGRVADGYQVLGVPWFVLTSPSGQIIWYWEVDTSGWLSRAALIAHVRAALARAPSAPRSGAAAARDLAGSSAPLSSLHAQAGQLLGPYAALRARIGDLHGFPIVINAWASWCTPCRSEFSLFAAASARYGRRVAFLGADTDDSPSDAKAFLAEHPVSYPSYQATISDFGSLAVIEGLPTTIFIDRAGRVVYVHIGQYDSAGTLDEDIGSYALDG